LRPRLLIFLNRLAIGGPASNTLALASLLSKEFDLLLVAGGPLPNERSAAFLLDLYKGFGVRMLPGISRSVNPFRDVLSYFKIRKIIQDFKPDIVHTHGSKPGIIGRWVAFRAHVPVIVHTYHGHVFHSYFPSVFSSWIVRLERMMAIKTHILIAINKQLKEELTDRYRIADTDKVKLCRLGIDASLFQDPGDLRRKKFRSAFHLSENDFVIAIVGRLVKIKQHGMFLELVQWLKNHNKSQKRLCFFVVGDGEEYTSVLQIAKRTGYQVGEPGIAQTGFCDIVFTSWLTDIREVMSGIDLLAMTSLNEGTPVSILEAMAAGKPVVSTPVGGIPELFEAAGSGFCGTSVAELGEHILKLIHSSDLYKEQSEKGHTYVAGNLSVQQQACETSALYKQAILSA